MIPAVAALASLLEQWDADAAVLARRGDSRGAELLRVCATEARAAIEEAGAEELNLERAAAESGYSTRHLRSLIADGKLVNRGRKNAPKVRRADLPRRAGSNGSGTSQTGAPAPGDRPTLVAGGYDLEAHVRKLSGKSLSPARAAQSR